MKEQEPTRLVGRTRPAPRCHPEEVGRATLHLPGGRTLTLCGGGLTIGSDGGCDLVLDDPYASSLHCTIRSDSGGLWLIDEGSRNGTWVNNVRVTRCALIARARVDIGSTRLSVDPGGAQTGAVNVHGLVGEHASMLRVYELIERFAGGDFPVLIVGETGTGKELVARAVHEASSVALGPFEALNCAAIPRELAESELFGHVRGAFTGAVSEFAGAFQRAEGGTLFLDEIGEMPLELQPKLLRVLEDGLVRPVGGERSRPTQVRLVAATHRELAHETERGAFRVDLFYRLAVGCIELPALRERRADIPLLLGHFLAREADRRGELSLEDGLVPWLQEQSWPGNVRALRHAIQRAVALCDGAVLSRHDFLGIPVVSAGRSTDVVELDGRNFEQIKAAVFRWALQQHDGNRTSAARSLDIPKSTFCDQLRNIGPQPPAGDIAGN